MFSSASGSTHDHLPTDTGVLGASVKNLTPTLRVRVRMSNLRRSRWEYHKVHQQKTALVLVSSLSEK